MRKLVYTMFLFSTFLFYLKVDLDTKDKIELIVSGVQSASSSTDGFAGNVDHLAKVWIGSDRVISYLAKKNDSIKPEVIGDGSKDSPKPDFSVTPEGNLLSLRKWGLAYQATFKIGSVYEIYTFYFLYDRIPDLLLTLFYFLFVIGVILIIERDRSKFGEAQRLIGMQSSVSSAHDMRSATLKIGLLESCLEGKAKDDLKQQTELLKQMIEQVINFSAKKLDSRDIKLIDAEKLIEETCKSLEFAKGKKDLELNLLAKKVKTYNLHFNQVVYNLLSNAYKYSDGQIHVKSRFHSISNKKYFRLEVSNNYSMETEEKLELYAFDFQSRFSNSNIKDSTGIGLFSAKSVVSALGGFLEIDRSSFYFTAVLDIPVETKDEFKEHPKEIFKTSANTLIKTDKLPLKKLEKIAIVDDDEKYSNLIGNIFTNKGIEVEIFRNDLELQNCLEMNEMTRKEPFDFVVFDRNINAKDVLKKDPKNGLDTIENLRIDCPSLPAVIIHSNSYHIPDIGINDSKSCFLRKDNGLSIENFTSVLKNKLDIEFKK